MNKKNKKKLSCSNLHSFIWSFYRATVSTNRKAGDIFLKSHTLLWWSNIALLLKVCGYINERSRWFWWSTAMKMKTDNHRIIELDLPTLWFYDFQPSFSSQLILLSTMGRLYVGTVKLGKTWLLEVDRWSRKDLSPRFAHPSSMKPFICSHQWHSWGNKVWV